MVEHVEADARAHGRGAITFDYGNNLRGYAAEGMASDDAFRFPGFVPEYIRPLFCEGKGPFRWVALSGDPEDIDRTDELVLELFPTDECALPLDPDGAARSIAFQGLPSRICWLGYGDRAKFGLRAQRARRQRRAEGADRHRPRPPRLRLGRLALPRDRRR